MNQEKPDVLQNDVLNVLAGLAQNTNPQTGSTLGDVAQGAYGMGKGAIDTLLYPFKATKDLLQAFGRDVINPTTPGQVGAPGGMWDRMSQSQQRYGDVTGSLAEIGKDTAEGSSVAPFGMQLGEAYNLWKQSGFPMGMYVLDQWTQRANDPSTSVQQLLQDHNYYHQQLGYGDENPHMSLYHDNLAYRVADKLGVEQPVLPEDFEGVFQKAAQKYPDAFTGMPAATEVPGRDVSGAESPVGQTPAEKIALYRQNPGGQFPAKTFSVNDQWDTFKRNAIQDLRRLGVDDETLGQLKDLGRSGAKLEDFSSAVQDAVDLPKKAVSVLDAWQEEIGMAKDLYSTLRKGGEFTPLDSSPVQDLEAKLFQSNAVPETNLSAAKALQEASDLYTARGDVGRASAYARAASLLTQKGTQDIKDLLDSGGPQSLIDAFKGQGGIGKSIASHLEDFVDQGSWPELDALRLKK